MTERHSFTAKKSGNYLLSDFQLPPDHPEPNYRNKAAPPQE
jgi:hypothetical protein